MSPLHIVYRYELLPTKEQVQTMFQTLKLCRKLYNWALEQRQTTYQATGKGITYNQQQNQLPAYTREHTEYKAIHSQVKQDVLRRLDAAFQRFFDQKAGYPRFKSRDHYVSFTYPQVNAVAKTFQEPGRIYLSGIGFVKMTTHREFPTHLVTIANVKFHGDKWFVNLTVDLAEAKLVESAKSVGIDRGLLHFAALSDGTIIDNPRHFRKSERKLAKLQRRLARKQKGSNNRGRAKRQVAKCHAQIANQRRDFLHKASFHVVQTYDIIILEDLKIKNMVRNHSLAKSIHDAGWGKFQSFVSYKTYKFGKRLILVNPAGTSQVCVCGEPVLKDLSVRVHACPACGLVEDRDVVSANVIKQRGMSLLTA